MEQHPLYRLYVELNDKVNKMTDNSKLAETCDLTDFIVRLKALETKPSYDSVIEGLTTKINNLEATNNELKVKLEQLSKIDALESRIYVLESEPKVNLDSINERLNVLEQNNLKTTLDDVASRLSTVETNTNVIGDVSYRVNELEKKPDLTERLSAIEQVVSKLSTTSTQQ